LIYSVIIGPSSAACDEQWWEEIYKSPETLKAKNGIVTTSGYHAMSFDLSDFATRESADQAIASFMSFLETQNFVGVKYFKTKI
jgi:hypothetical protein